MNGHRDFHQSFKLGQHLGQQIIWNLEHDLIMHLEVEFDSGILRAEFVIDSNNSKIDNVSNG